MPSRTARAFERHKLARAFLWVLIVTLALWLRALPIGAGLPYLRYIDEGHVLHDTITMLKEGKLDTGFYNYPSLPRYLIAGALCVYAPIYGAIHGQSFWSELHRDNAPGTGSAQFYDHIWPTDVIVVARVVMLLFSVGTVVLAGMLGRLVGGSRTAFLALLVTALCPALVSRGAIVLVDTLATFFAITALYFAQRLQPNTEAPWRFAVAAGASAGLAFVSKYLAGAVLVAVLVRLTIAHRPAMQKARLNLLSCVGFLGASVLVMPALITNTAAVAATIRGIAGFYHGAAYDTSYWRALLSPAEIGIPLLITGLLGLALLLHRSRATRVAALSWLAFALVLIAAVGRAKFQPFRNLVPLVPPLCVAAAFLLARGDLWFRRAKVRRFVNAWVEPAAALILTLSLALPAWREIERQRAVVDTRVAAINWLQQNTRPEDRILAIRELAIHPAEWRRIARVPTVLSWLNASEAVEARAFDVLVSGDFSLQFASDKEAWSKYREKWDNSLVPLATAASFGSVPCPVDPGAWRTNHERLTILRPQTP